MDNDTIWIVLVVFAFAAGAFAGWLSGQLHEWDRQATLRMAYFETEQWKKASYEGKAAVFTFFDYLRRQS